MNFEVASSDFLSWLFIYLGLMNLGILIFLVSFIWVVVKVSYISFS